jgi:hypothetical protein
MTIKLLVLKSGEDIVADVQEMVVEDKVVGYFLNKPCIVKMVNYTPVEDEETTEKKRKNAYQVKFYPWVPLAKDPMIPISMDWIVTMVEPMDKLTKLYVEDILEYDQRTKINQDSNTDDESDSDQSD